MTDADHSERLADQLLTLIRRYYAREPSFSELPEKEALLDWVARDAGIAQTRAQRDASLRKAEAFAQRVLAKSFASRYGIQAIQGSPSDRPPLVAGPPSRVMEVAAEHDYVPCAELAVAAGAGRALWDEECDRWIPRPANVPRGRYLALRVAGDSMMPLVHAGDTILVKLGADVQRGTIIVAQQPDDGGYVIKCVRSVNAAEIELESLNEAYPVITIPRTPHTVLGTVIMRWCAH